MRLNTFRKTVSRKPTGFTHEGAPSFSKDSNAQKLRRTVLAHMLWEDSFYEDGQSVADRIASLVSVTDPLTVASIACEARNAMKLRHVPLLLAREMARNGTHRSWVGSVLEEIIQRPDELAEFLSIYWKDGRCKLANQVKKGLARAFTKFDEYSLAKYDQKGKNVSLRDVLFLSHAKPKDSEQAALWKRLIDGKMATPKTWEVKLSESKGEDKKAVWEDLLEKEDLGCMALIRNLRNMEQAGVSRKKIADALLKADASRVLPFRFISAARHAPNFEPELEQLMFKSIEGLPKLEGHTLILIDVSGSMDDPVSEKSEINRIDAASGLAMVARELCESVEVMTFSDSIVQVPARRGFALKDAIWKSQSHGGTRIGDAVCEANKHEYDRIIVITDEQSHDAVDQPRLGSKAYMLNVGHYQTGVGYGSWNTITGWSDAVVGYISALESFNL